MGDGKPRLSCLSSPLLVRMLTLTTSPRGGERGKGFLWYLLIRALILSGELQKDPISKYHLTGQWSFNIRIWKQRAQSSRHSCRVGSWNAQVWSVQGLTGIVVGAQSMGMVSFSLVELLNDPPSSFLLSTSELQKRVVWWRK